jgi:hypothetical protein
LKDLFSWKIFQLIISYYTDGLQTLLSPHFRSHDIVQKFHQDYFELPEDGASNAPKHVAARWYTNI